MTDSIADMLTRIRNAQAVGHKTVSFPHSKTKLEIAKILSREGFLGSVTEKGRGPKKDIEAVLKYRDSKNTAPQIQGLIKISKGGQRIYAHKNELGKISKGQGIIILTTSLGLMTDKEARKGNVGGEIILRIW